MLPVFARHTIKVVRPGKTTDRYGNEIPDWSTATRTTVLGCSVQPTFGEEDTMHRDAVQSEYTIYAPAGTDVTAYDRIEWQGKDYEVVGRPSVWSIGMGAVDHVVIHANLWEG